MSETITIVGRLGADPELRFAANGDAICNLRVVTSKRYKDANGDWQDKDTTWWSVTAWRQLGENCAESLTKGTDVIIRGEVKSREYQTQQGEKRVAWEVEAKAVGPDLSRATAKVAKVQRQQAAGPGREAFTAARGAMDDPWATPAQSESAPF